MILLGFAKSATFSKELENFDNFDHNFLSTNIFLFLNLTNV